MTLSRILFHSPVKITMGESGGGRSLKILNGDVPASQSAPRCYIYTERLILGLKVTKLTILPACIYVANYNFSSTVMEKRPICIPVRQLQTIPSLYQIYWKQRSKLQAHLHCLIYDHTESLKCNLPHRTTGMTERESPSPHPTSRGALWTIVSFYFHVNTFISFQVWQTVAVRLCNFCLYRWVFKKDHVVGMWTQ